MRTVLFPIDYSKDFSKILFILADVELMPLEIKTGKASFSSEHRGQVIIYQMMMSEVGQKVDNGLLLYLRFVFAVLVTSSVVSFYQTFTERA